MSDGVVRFSVAAGVATVIFDRPQARNALTWRMYQELARICVDVAGDPAIRCVIFRGAGEDGAFVAGTDITQFQSFAGAEDGIAYERSIDASIEAIERLPVPSIAVVRGVAAGAGLMIATACDFRFATEEARFGVPVARTVGNCLSMANVARLLAAFGPALTRRMLLLAETLSATEAAACGFAEMMPAAVIEARVETVCRRLGESAPLTVWATREAVRRLTLRALPDGDDIIRQVYGSADFKAGVAAFMAKKRAVWQGR
jgi:enoyl-CoA hydratase/carnithine racemase